MNIQTNLCMQSKLSKACMLLPNHHNSSFSPAYLSELYLLSNKSRPLHCPPLIHFSINKKVPSFIQRNSSETMENFMKQMRGRFSSAEHGKTEESSSIRNQWMPPQKTRSFKAERTQNWFGKPFSGKMTSWNDDSNHKPEQVLAVAAAAATYVINSIAEPSIQDQKKTSAGLGPSLTRDKSRKEDTSFSTSKPGTVSKQFSGEGSTKGSGSAESKVALPDGTDDNETKSAPSLKRPLTFADYLGNTSITKQRSSPKPDMLSSQTESAAPKPDVSTIKPASKAPKPDHPAIKPGTAAGRPEEPPTIEPRPETEQTKAEDWEKDEMAKIKERYKKLNSTILAWEEKKKKKAKNKLDRTESGLERKRARALLKFKNEMEYIKQAVDGARAQAEASQKKDELKAKEKANIIRKTGEVPRACFCC
ncbi:uncharacterized protein LOC105783520 isoform X1 [Gossypium raimondii]|uniref:Remorin C-terminal domain-containing protein n=2 Tax=Gossypium raimondii TaxID=29730 RepID=A0A0D2TY48_GOSRA|nr:uncharacterized protein LOC105783520 isoform X1 [Gossypium raimondii]KJB80323.1 hypothetical protein B456_013G091700 [Gossypium raimondii]